MSKGDLLVERGAAKLQELSRKAAGRGDNVGEWLSEELRADAEFLRKLKPSLIAARAKGGNPPAPGPSNGAGDTPRDYAGPPPPPQPPPPPPAAKPKAKKNRSKGKRSGPPPLLIVGGALVAGIVLAKVIDWRGHAHPRD